VVAGDLLGPPQRREVDRRVPREQQPGVGVDRGTLSGAERDAERGQVSVERRRERRVELGRRCGVRRQWWSLVR
jgi:hypothetical protein